MRTFILLVFASFLSMNLSGQSDEKEDMKPGDYLEKAGKQGNGAIACYALGLGMGGALIGQGISNDQSSMLNAGYAVGGLGAAFGLILTLSSNSNIKKAGQALNEGGISLHESERGDLNLSSTRRGIGLTYTFR